MLLIRAAHPDLQAAIDNREETVVSGDLEYNPRLHLAMHELVANQIIEDDPPEVWRTAHRLHEHGYRKHEILHMLAYAISGEMWHMLHDHRDFDHDAHVKALEALPESWERQRPDGPAPPASRASHATRATAQRKATRAARRKNRRR